MLKLGPFLASLTIGYYAPTFPVSLPMILLALYGLVETSPWWSLLLQTLLGLATSVFLMRAIISYERWHVFRIPFEAADIIDFSIALLSAVVFGFLYDDMRPASPTIPVREIGALTAVALVLAWIALTYLAKQFWFRCKPYEPVLTARLIELICLVLMLDILVWGATTAARIGIGVVVVVRYLVLILQTFVLYP